MLMLVSVVALFTSPRHYKISPISKAECSQACWEAILAEQVLGDNR